MQNYNHYFYYVTPFPIQSSIVVMDDLVIHLALEKIDSLKLEFGRDVQTTFELD